MCRQCQPQQQSCGSGEGDGTLPCVPPPAHSLLLKNTGLQPSRLFQSWVARSASSGPWSRGRCPRLAWLLSPSPQGGCCTYLVVPDAPGSCSLGDPSHVVDNTHKAPDLGASLTSSLPVKGAMVPGSTSAGTCRCRASTTPVQVASEGAVRAQSLCSGLESRHGYMLLVGSAVHRPSRTGETEDPSSHSPGGRTHMAVTNLFRKVLPT